MQLRLTEAQVRYAKYQMSVLAADNQMSLSVPDYRLVASVIYEGGEVTQDNKHTLNTAAINTRTLN